MKYSLIVWGASSIQFGFFMQTGAEVAWAASNSFLSDPAAMKILLSGISTVSAAATVFGLIAWLIHAKIYHWTGLGLQAIRDLCSGSYRARYTLLGVPNKSWLNKSWMTAMDLRTVRRIAITVSICSSLLFLELTRPSIPYDHLSGALPLTLLDAFTKKSSTTEGCRQSPMRFPLWTDVKTGFMANSWSRPSWLPPNPPPGFSRYEHSPDERAEKDNPSWYLCNDNEPGFYNPKTDPLKISNLGGDIYEPLKAAFEVRSVEIDHVILLTLESGRKELFPMQQGTPMFDALIESHAKEDREEAIDRLVTMTPISQMLTGEYATDSKGEKVDLSGANWQDSAAEGMGGLNVRGALTGSSLTFKSILGSHCGVHPLPVDLLEETGLEIYQPCLPQLFELFNTVKNPNPTPEILARDDSASEALKNPWKSVFMQSITDDYDRQDVLNENMGFKHKVVKSTLTSQKSKYRAKGQEINYFGFAETELKPYVRDLFEEAANNKTRMFLSHVTSTTHHPWNTPDDFAIEHYMGNEGSINHNMMNNYLNSARFVDNWLGDIMTMLDETGIANSTLVVIVGDHGQAFGLSLQLDLTILSPNHPRGCIICPPRVKPVCKFDPSCRKFPCHLLFIVIHLSCQVSEQVQQLMCMICRPFQRIGETRPLVEMIQEWGPSLRQPMLGTLLRQSIVWYFEDEITTHVLHLFKKLCLCQVGSNFISLKNLISQRLVLNMSINNASNRVISVFK